MPLQDQAMLITTNMPTKNDPLKIFVDTSTFVSLQDISDPNHQKAKKLALKLQELDAHLYTSSDIIGEALTVISRKLGKQKAHEFYREYLKSGMEEIFIGIKLSEKTRKLFFKVKSKNISFIDCSNIIAMESAGIKSIFAFDQDFKKLGVLVF